MHGLGNDFVLVDGFEEKLDEAVLPERAREVCDRHFGIGADGFILVLPSRAADFRWRIFNPDGSEPESCGNGIRCLAKFVYEREMTRETTLTVETLGGVKTRKLQVRVWERGAGETLACGSGACASVIAAARTERADRRATVHLLGGELQIEWSGDGHVHMTGPAVEVFTGEL